MTIPFFIPWQSLWREPWIGCPSHAKRMIALPDNLWDPPTITPLHICNLSYQRQRGHDGKWQLVGPSCQRCRMSENLAENPTPSASSSTNLQTCDTWNHGVNIPGPSSVSRAQLVHFSNPACPKCRHGKEYALRKNMILRWRAAILLEQKAIHKFDHQYPSDGPRRTHREQARQPYSAPSKRGT